MQTRTSRQSGFTRVGKIIMILAVVLIVLIVAMAITFVGPRNGRNYCLSNLKQLEGAKRSWSLETKAAATTVPADSDIFGPSTYIRVKPLCPSGGIYSLNALSVNPTCSKSGAPDFHTL